MMNKKDDLLALTPLEDYQTPELPTLEEGISELLKIMPTRWKNKAMITAIVGMLGVTSLTGCGVYDNYNDDYHYHHGGAGGGPIYIAYLKEQEALGIIRNQLEEVGLNFDSAPPTHNIIYDEGGWNEQTIGLDLFDEENNIGIALVNFWWWNSQHERAIEIVDELTQEVEDDGIHVGVIFNQENDAWNTRDREQMEERFEEYLIEQTQNFIQHLQEEGVID